MTTDMAVIGLGYVGMPLARAAARAGLDVLGFDVDPGVVEGLRSGLSHVDDLGDDDIREMLAHGFEATTDAAALAEARAVVICVPTPLSEEGRPDLAAVAAASRTVARHLRPGMLVVLESTTYPGTTEEFVRPMLEESGLTAGQDFELAYSPERIDPGNAVYDVHNTPKIVGGLTASSTEAARALYSRFIDTVVPAKGTREAETSKLLENTYRHINIALVNEMAQFCNALGIDLWNVIDMASTKPFGFAPFYPGPGVGGHCIPIDPNYLSHKVRSQLGYPFRFVELAQEINASMPTYVCRRVQDILNEDRLALSGASILLLGVTYKPDIADVRESPATPLARQLRAKGAEVSFHDPAVDRWDLGEETLTGAKDLSSAVAEADLVILVQHHSAYDVDALASAAQRFFDTRGRATVPGVHRL